ncbi:hypothetical protein AB833_28675 [Chromatiales bacterium (ex Bugula neritina AB1)]|nr:hypothetical protein AB833_28675 [Chromatiales bacterium (ex Bugula neritina AB1)]
MICTLSVLIAISAVALTSVHAETIDSRPVVYLTFDDGPSADNVTDAVLEILAKHDAKATFFVTGQRTRSSPEKIQKILYGGHSLGNHTDDHARLTEVSSDRVFYELNTANVAVLNAGGPPLTCFRPPFGLTDSIVNSIAEDLGLVSVKWTIETRDWDSGSDVISIRKQLDGIKDGSIVLMHDGPIKRSRTLQALDYWMDDNSHRYQFRTLPQCNTYGELTIASVVEEAPKQKTIDELLEKLRGYRFSLDQIVGQSTDQLTARLSSEIVSQ